MAILLSCARPITVPWEGFLPGKRHLIYDRDTPYSRTSAGVWRDSGKDRQRQGIFAPV
jgi:hypothetical protein